MQEEPSLGLLLPWGGGLEATRPAGTAGSRKYLPRLPSAAGGKGGEDTWLGPLLLVGRRLEDTRPVGATGAASW